MYVNRRVFITEPGTFQDVFELCQRILERHPYPNATRVYRSEFGEFNHVVVEWECESLTDYDKIHSKWAAEWSEDLRTEWRSFKIDGRNEFWEVVEQRTDG